MGSKYDSKTYQKVIVIEGHQIYKAIWTPTTGKELSVQSEDDNEHNEHSVAVIKDGLLWGIFDYHHGQKLCYNRVVSSLCCHNFFVFASPSMVILPRGYCATPLTFIRDPVFISYTVGLHQAFIRDQRLLETDIYLRLAYNRGNTVHE